MKSCSRRSFLAGAAACAAYGLQKTAWAKESPFKISVINDEISQDFDRACYVASHDFRMRWIELRSMWGKNITDLSAADIDKTQKILSKYELQVTDIASPLFKTSWPGAPLSRYGGAGDMHLAAEATFKQQDEILDQCIALAKQFKTGKVRCFDFWRLDDVAPYRAAINEKLRATAEIVGQQGFLLLLENEPDCNTATGTEAARTMNAIRTQHLALNWDAANSVMSGESYTAGWEALPKNRIHHCHVKNTARNATAIFDSSGKMDWAPIDNGIINWAEQFRWLKQAGYRDAVSLETHWDGGGSREQSTRICWTGMKQALEAASAL